MYVIKRNGDGHYVATPGSRASYTTNLQAAQKFATKEAAQASACGNESVHAVSSLRGMQCNSR